MEQSPVSVVITDPNGAIEYVDPYFTEVTGYGEAEVIGRRPSVLKYRWRDVGRRVCCNVADHFFRCHLAESSQPQKDGSLYWERASIFARAG